MTDSQLVLGCIDTAADGKDHQLQLWIERSGENFVYVIRSQYQPGGKISKRAELDRGVAKAANADVVDDGRKAFAKMQSPAVV